MQFIEQANKHLPTAEILDTERTFLNTNTGIYKGERFKSNSVLDIRTHFKPTETFQHRHFSSCRLPGVKKGFVKGEALRLLRTNSSKKLFEELIQNFKSRLRERGYSKNLVQRTLSEAQFKNRELALLQKPQESKRILLFVSQYYPAAPNLKQILVKAWHFIQRQPLLKEI